MGCPGLLRAPGPGSPRLHKHFVQEGLSLSPGWSSTSTHRDTLPLPAVPATPTPWHSQDICSPPQALSLWFSPHRACRTQPDPLQQADVLSPAPQDPQRQADASPAFPSGHPKNSGERGTPLELSAKRWDVRTIPSGCHHCWQKCPCKAQAAW